MATHARCYARALNTCSPRISREHYVSRTVLDLLGDEHRISNARWLAKGQQSDPLPTRALGSRVLCEAHNRVLSPLDSHAERVFAALLWGLSDTPPLVDRREIAVSGDLLELWLLKACCGALASGSLREDRRAVPSVIPDDWVHLLFSGAAWPSDAGMYVRQSTLHPFQGYSIGPVYVEDSCVGGGFHFLGTELFILPHAIPAGRMLEESSDDMRPLVYRPGAIRIESRTRMIEIRLEWGTWTPTAGIRYQWVAEPRHQPTR